MVKSDLKYWRDKPGIPYDHADHDNNHDRLMYWSGPYVADTTYTANEVVRDGEWLSIANKTTTDRPAPIPSESTSWDVPDVPTFDVPDPEFNGLVHSGHRYTFAEAVWIRAIQVWVPEVTADTTYRFIISNVTNPAVPVVTVVEEPVLAVNQWTSIAFGATIYPAGTIFEIINDALNSGSDTIVSGGWTRDINSNTNPAAQSWNRNSSETIVRIDKTDLDSVDRGVELLSAIPGSTIQIVNTLDATQSRQWSVTSTTDGGSSVNYGVTEITTGPGGEPPVGATCTITITVPVPSPTKYSEWTGGRTAQGNPTWATVEGIKELGGVDDPAAATNIYGIRVLAQRAYVSPDWDSMATLTNS